MDKLPGITSFPAEMHRNRIVSEYGIMLLIIQLKAYDMSELPRFGRSSFFVPRITSIPVFSRAARTVWLGANKRTLVMFLDFMSDTTLLGGGRLFPSNP